MKNILLAIIAAVSLASCSDMKIRSYKVRVISYKNDSVAYSTNYTRCFSSRLDYAIGDTISGTFGQVVVINKLPQGLLYKRN